jgi:hypothetical protein
MHLSASGYRIRSYPLADNNTYPPAVNRVLPPADTYRITFCLLMKLKLGGAAWPKAKVGGSQPGVDVLWGRAGGLLRANLKQASWGYGPGVPQLGPKCCGFCIILP